jgi:Tol biopolymer transport system component
VARVDGGARPVQGEQGELVIANSDGSEPKILGQPGEFPWATWSPDGRQIACLSLKGISLVDLASRQVVSKLERKGFFQQITWSPDGRWLVGVANSFGTGWSIARLDLASGEAAAIHRVDCCTPDWFPDSQNLVFSWRPQGQSGNGGQGWSHPVHIHFEEGQVLARDGKAANVPPWERGRKDVYRLRPGGSITLTMQFRDWGGMFMEHCHNTVHEDNAMLLRWEIDNGGAPFLRPLPTPLPSAQGVKFAPPTDVLGTAL